MKVFLGGAPAPTDWRQAIAVPALVSAGCELVMPDQDSSGCNIYLFVFDRLARNVDTIVKACEAIYRGKNVLLVVMDMIPGTPIEGSMLTSNEARDLNIGRSALADFGVDAGCEVFSSVESAVAYLIGIVKPEPEVVQAEEPVAPAPPTTPVEPAVPAPPPEPVLEPVAPETSVAPESPVEPEPAPEPPAPPAE